MKFTFSRLLPVLLVTIAVCPTGRAAPVPLSEIQAEAARSGLELNLPEFPGSADELKTRAAAALKSADEQLTRLAAQPVEKVTFANSAAAVDRVISEVSFWENLLQLIGE